MSLPKATLRAAEDLARAGNYTEAIRRLDELAANNPREPKIWASRAYINGRRNDRAAAIADWSTAISLCDKEPHYFYMRGIELFHLGRYRDAVEDFTRVIDLCDYHDSAYYREPGYFFRADAYVRLREFEKARLDCVHVSDSMRTWTDRLRSKADLLAECQ